MTSLTIQLENLQLENCTVNKLVEVLDIVKNASRKANINTVFDVMVFTEVFIEVFWAMQNRTGVVFPANITQYTTSTKESMATNYQSALDDLKAVKRDKYLRYLSNLLTGTNLDLKSSTVKERTSTINALYTIEMALFDIKQIAYNMTINGVGHTA